VSKSGKENVVCVNKFLFEFSVVVNFSVENNLHGVVFVFFEADGP